jgi:hypothetical protein
MVCLQNSRDWHPYRIRPAQDHTLGMSLALDYEHEMNS